MRLDWIDALLAIVIAAAIAVMIVFPEPAKKSKMAPVVEGEHVPEDSLIEVIPSGEDGKRAPRSPKIEKGE